MPERVSGLGNLYTFTANVHRWADEIDPQYVLAIVSLSEQDHLHIVTNIVGCSLDEVRIGMPVEVAFDLTDEAAIPVFRPVH